MPDGPALVLWAMVVVELVILCLAAILTLLGWSHR